MSTKERNLRMAALGDVYAEREKYDALIRSIRKKRRWVIFLTVIGLFAILFLTAPVSITVMEETVVKTGGAHPVLTLILLVLGLFFGMLSYALVSMPLSHSMEAECEPEKHLILNVMLGNPKQLDTVYAVDYFYLGNFENAKGYAERMTENPASAFALSGLFNKARCEFMLGDAASLEKTAAAYGEGLRTARVRKKQMEAFVKMQKAVSLMCALTVHDRARVVELSASLERWNTVKPSECFYNYLKGCSALEGEDLIEAIYRFKVIEEHFGETVFYRLATEQIKKLTE